MAKYKNGRVPASLLVKRDPISLTRGTWARWDRLVSIVKSRHGVTLVISPGSSAVTRGAGGYRSYEMQVAVKEYWTAQGKPQQAAAPGTSSHGGEFRGRDALAIDVYNWGTIGQAKLFAAAKEVGFTVGVFNGVNSPNEPWHIIDYDPYRPVGGSGGGSNQGSETIKAIQRTLNGIGYAVAVDGIQGPATTAAIKKFQSAWGVAADGIWGPKTAAAYSRWLKSWKKTIKQGSKGTAVKMIQWRLGLAQDSIFGPKTKAAVIAYQRKNGLTADGIAGPKTWAKLGY